ncbi:MAG: hypothetical protein K8L99_02345 [Anaerolineae bacterium]|nr:hypothetical protein [Anaerolineae bacterium]
MDFETVTSKQLGIIEQCTRELIEALRRAKFNQETIYSELLLLEEAVRKERQARFDLTDQPHKGY